MSTNSHFTIAVHILTLLGHHAPKPLTSDFIASSVNTNPVFIRRLLAALRSARLVSSQAGPGGGWVLRRAARDVSLRDVYRAMEERPLFAPHSKTPNSACEVGGNIEAVLGRRFEATLRTLEQQLAKSSIHDLVREIRNHGSYP